MARSRTAVVKPLDPREMRAFHALIRSHARITRVLEAELDADHGLSLPAYEVLAHLSEAPQQRLRMSDLATCAVLTPSGLTRLVDKLTRDGLVRRVKCGRDGRVVYAELTAEGKSRLVAAYPTHLRGVRDHLIDRLSPLQRDNLIDALEPLTRSCPGAEPSEVPAAS